MGWEQVIKKVIIEVIKQVIKEVIKELLEMAELPRVLRVRMMEAWVVMVGLPKPRTREPNTKSMLPLRPHSA